MKRLVIVGILFLSFITMYSQQYIADYTIAKEKVLRSIPDEYIDKARSEFNMMYWHESHGAQIMRGLFGLEQYKTGDDTKYGISYESYDTNKFGVWDIWNDSSSIIDAIDYFGQITRDSLLKPANANINVIMWAWCPFENTRVPRYLDTMQVLINEFGEGGTRIGTGAGQREKPVNFIFMTGHAAGVYNTYEDGAEEAADSINAFCERHGYYCLDFYSMDTHDMDDNYWDDATENAVSVKYHNAGGSTDNFYQDWQDTHTLGEDWFYGRQSNGYPNPGGGHVDQHISCNRKVYSLWWILAHLAGWDDTPTAIASEREKKNEIIYSQKLKKLIFDCNTFTNAVCSVYNLTGSLCIERRINTSTLSLADLSKGIYIVALKTTEGITTKKILITD